MKKRLHDKSAGIAILAVLIIIALVEVIFRATVIGKAALTTSNLGEQLTVIALAAFIMIMTVMGKDRICYICYGAWVGYFVLDQLFELPGTIIRAINFSAQTADAGLVGVIRVVVTVCIIAIGGILVEYMNDGTIHKRAFNALCVVTVLLLAVNIVFSVIGAVAVSSMYALDTFYGLYRIAMVFLFAFFAYDSAKMQLKKTKLS